MKLYIDLDNIPSPEQFDEWERMMLLLIGGIKEMKISLSNEERSSRRKMGNRHASYARTAKHSGVQYEQIMPRHFTPEQFEKLLNFFDRMRRLRSYGSELFEHVDDTTMAAGIDAMTLTKVVHDAIRSANKVDPAYDSILKELDEYNKRAQAEEAEEEDDISDTKD